MKKWAWLLLIPMILGAFVCAILWIGIVEDAEFSERSLFIKAHPTFKLYFYTPIGMSDMEIDDLEGIRREEELAYRYYFLGKE